MAGGIRFGQYVLLRRIARGGMAEVFLAQQQGLEGFDRRVAVKRILPHLVDSPDFVKMFLGEAKLAAQLSHPNVVHIYDFGKVGGDYFIAMEYVEGVHAGQLFKLGDKTNPAGSRMSPTLVARLGADAAAALHYAHELRGPNGKPLGLVHRDVSPANLMVSFDGVVKLCDFGIAKAAALSDQLTNPGQVKGKYAYMSPEQTIAAPLDGRSDVFSLAIVLWELLAGKTIVGRGDAVDSMRAIRDGKLEPIERAAPDTPPELARAIHWALETKREQRATAADLAQALEAFIKSSPELATPMQLAGWVRARFTRDNTGEQAAVPEAGGGTAASGGGTLAAPGTAAGMSTAATPPTSADRPRSITPRPGEVPVGRPKSATRPPPEPGRPPEGGRPKSATRPPPVEPLGRPTLQGRPPEALIAASRLTPPPDEMEGAETVALDPDAVAAARVAARVTVIAEDPRPPAKPASKGRSRKSAPSDPTAQLDMADLEEHHEEADDDDPFAGDGEETVARSGSRRPQVSSAAAVVPTLFEVPSLAPNMPSPPSIPITGVRQPNIAELAASAAAATTRARPPRRGATTHISRRGPRVAVSIGVLLAIGVASFLIALAARSRSHPATVADAAAPPADAVALSVVPLPPDAGGTGPDAGPPVDAAPLATVDAAPEPEGILDVTTTPNGATIKVGDQSRTAPAKLALPAGHYVVTAELRGWVAERREVDIERNEHVTQEIAFTHRMSATPHGPDRAPLDTSGKLSVKTTPYSEVFTSAGHSLGQTPLAEIELPAGSHVLTFKNPAHPDVTKRVTIVSGKTTKLSFTLP